VIACLKILVAGLCVYMIYIVVDTSLRSNLFEEWDNLAAMPWMIATLKDFYINLLFIYLWAAYKERRWSLRLLWLILFAGLGAIAVTFYLLLALFRLEPGEGVPELLTKRRPAFEQG